jgi:hypothetical protein
MRVAQAIVRPGMGVGTVPFVYVAALRALCCRARTRSSARPADAGFFLPEYPDVELVRLRSPRAVKRWFQAQ